LSEIGVRRVRYINYNEVSKCLYLKIFAPLNPIGFDHFAMNLMWIIINVSTNIDQIKENEEEIKQEKLDKPKAFG